MPGEETWRLFVAVFPPPEIQQRLAEATRDLESGLSPKAVAWTRPEQIHLTLNFLGNVECSRVDEFARTIEQTCLRSKPHLLRAQGIGCFPSASRPQIIWAGLAGAVAVLQELKKSLDESLAKLGYVPETRPFHPHLTIGRVKQLKAADRRHLAATLPPWREKEFGSWTAERIDLMRSTLSPTGAKYALLQSFALNPATAP
jgi:RNA 2',3'-cyclic 3'-phosphodiesterase